MSIPFDINTIFTSSNIALWIALSLVIIYALYLDRKVYKLTRGQSGSSLEEIIASCVNAAKEIEDRNELISKHALSLDEKVSHSLRNIQTLRYKAFDTNSSNQSFSVALLNEKGDGVVISSLHTHDRNSVFAKPITKYDSEYELTEEEIKVIEQAKHDHKSIGKLG